MWWWWMACAGKDGGDTVGGVDDSGEPPETPSTTTDTDPPEVAGVELLTRLSGLWTGSATQTPLGSFPLMNVDLRAADAHAIWGRVDVDPENALRFAFEVEDHDGPVLVYRNGGYFLGLLRDDRTVLVESDPAAGVWRFCHVDEGCDYIDATFTATGDDLVEDVKVRGAQHLLWEARRAEERAVPGGFPDPTPLPPDAPLPVLPTLDVSVSWSTPTDGEVDVWLILATTPCLTSCVPSRFSRVVVGEGATDAVVSMPEIHAGDYYATAVVDRDRNLALTLLPSAADGVSLPNRPLSVAATGTTTESVPIAIGG